MWPLKSFDNRGSDKQGSKNLGFTVLRGRPTVHVCEAECKFVISKLKPMYMYIIAVSGFNLESGCNPNQIFWKGVGPILLL